jgi:hypothetical protein
MANKHDDQDRLFTSCRSQITITIPASCPVENHHAGIQEYLRTYVEGTCIREGFVRPNSIRTSEIEISLPQLEGSNFNYRVAFYCFVCVLGNGQQAVVYIHDHSHSAGWTCYHAYESRTPMACYLPAAETPTTSSSTSLTKKLLLVEILASSYQHGDTILRSIVKFVRWLTEEEIQQVADKKSILYKMK